MSPLAAPAQLPAAPPAPEKAKLAAAAKQFEAIFVRQMLSAARKADFGEPLLGGQAMDTFRQMQDERFADIAAGRGSFGIAKMLETQFAGIPPRNGERDHPKDGGGVVTSTKALDKRRGLDPSVSPFGPATSPFRGGIESPDREP